MEALMESRKEIARAPLFTPHAEEKWSKSETNMICVRDSPRSRGALSKISAPHGFTPCASSPNLLAFHAANVQRAWVIAPTGRGPHPHWHTYFLAVKLPRQPVPNNLFSSWLYHQLLDFVLPSALY